MATLFLLGALCASVPATVSQTPASSLDRAMERVYSFDFERGQTLAAEAVERDRQDPLAPAILTYTRLFAELHRLDLLANELGSKAKRKPDAAARRAMLDSIAETERRAKALAADDPRAMLALMMVRGAERDWLALVEQSYRASWTSAREAQAIALRLTALHPDVKDAWFNIGFSDYLVASVPFIFRPFMKMEQADGNRQRAIANLEKTAGGGRFLRGFAQLMLARIYRKEQRPRDAERMLQQLVRDYPDNSVLRREAASPAGGL